ncbi:hypothetical protein TNCV_3099121 [Trichonephila clavipes]|nr:hypothetical protein TNCV_3099121 [Trichonephila clavipes]
MGGNEKPYEKNESNQENSPAERGGGLTSILKRSIDAERRRGIGLKAFSAERSKSKAVTYHPRTQNKMTQCSAPSPSKEKRGTQKRSTTSPVPGTSGKKQRARKRSGNTTPPPTAVVEESLSAMEDDSSADESSSEATTTKVCELHFLDDAIRRYTEGGNILGMAYYSEQAAYFSIRIHDSKSSFSS